MIRRIRVFANALHSEIVDEIRVGFQDLANHSEDERSSDADLDVLVRHAMVSAASSEADTRKVWKKLSGRVRGPFGRIAVEGPSISNAEASCMQGLPAPFSLGMRAVDAVSGQLSAPEKTSVTLSWRSNAELNFR